MNSMTVRDAMHKGVVSCDSSTTVHEAARMMNELKLRSLIVVDFDCALGGFISETDIVAAKLLNEAGRSWDQLTVGEVMTNRVLTVTPDMPLTEAARIIVDHRIHRAVVAEPDDICNPIGVLSLGDIMRYIEALETGAPHVVATNAVDTIEVIEAEVVTVVSAPADASPTKRAARKPAAKKAAKKPAAKKGATKKSATKRK